MGIAEQAEDRLGLTCAQVLAMKPDQWAEYYNKKKPGGEAGYDQAYDAYSQCMKRRNDDALAKLPRKSAERLRRYRDLCGKFRVDELELQQAYAGGGTMYTHATVRGQVDDERLIGRLAKLYAQRGSFAVGGSAGIARLRRRLSGDNPATARNRKRLAEFTLGGQATTAYAAASHDLAALSRLLGAERRDAQRIIIKYLDENSRSFGG